MRYAWTWKKTHTCGELRASHVGQAVTLCGWTHSSRDHGGVIFIDLRDRYGLTQVVFNPTHCQAAHDAANRFRAEWVIAVHGTVRHRPEGMVNPKMATGEIELMVDEVELLNEAQTPPFEIDDTIDVAGETRLRYRYMDLRRPDPQRALIFRSDCFRAIRSYFAERASWTSRRRCSTKSTPEGARDYLVPSRVNPGSFYALPQSPQLFKQILMIAGLRPLRADRQVPPRRGPAGRPPARVHPARRRDVLRHSDDVITSWRACCPHHRQVKGRN